MKRLLLYASAAGFIVNVVADEIRHAVARLYTNVQAKLFGSSPRDRNIVIVGASFAGHHVARLVAAALPPRSRFRVVVVEPNSHFQFTWLLPRFCVVPDHEDKAFIPYGGYATALPGAMKWVQDTAVRLGPTHVVLDTGEPLPYDVLVVATGSAVKHGLPSRVNEADKSAGVQRLRQIQKGVRDADTVVVVGGGAAGVEVAADAKDMYPDKRVVLVHSRGTVMNRFGVRLQQAAADGLQRLGVEVILQDRVTKHDEDAHVVTLQSGKQIPCGCFINCTSQTPQSSMLQPLSPTSISPSGHIKVLSTLQIADAAHPSIYACGDVIGAETPCPNARSAMHQATVVARNILRVVGGKAPKHEYKHHWIETFIKLTLGLDRSVTYMGDGDNSLLFHGKDKDVTLMAAQAWSRMGQTPYVDDDDNDKTKKAAA